MNTMKPMMQHRELISALADGQLASEELAHVLAVCEADAEALDSWNTCHLIGDVLRAPGLAAHATDMAFVERLRLRLREEPSLVMPQAASVAVVMAAPFAGEAANDANMSWKLVAGFASIAAVSAIAWNVASGVLSPSSAPQLAQARPAPPQVLVVSEQGNIVRDARMQELLAAHKQFGGTSALQVPSGFLRNATFESSQGERR